MPRYIDANNLELSLMFSKDVYENVNVDGLHSVISIIDSMPTKDVQHWIPVSDRLPDTTDPVNITWVNRNPPNYYANFKDVPFVATGHYCNGRWYWFSAVCQDYLNVYGDSQSDRIDDAVEVTAWKPLPEPYKGGDDNA